MARILIIDDEELALYTLRQILESADHEVIEAHNGNEGLELQKRGNFDLVVTDIIMPEKEGGETIIELKQLYPDLKIIAISGGGRTRNLDLLKIAEKLGASRMLAKPFSKLELLECVDGCLGEGDRA